MTKGKKIALISVSAVVALIVITIIVLALVKTTFFSLNVSNASSLRVFVNGEEISVGICTNPDKHNLASNEGQKIFNQIEEKSKTNSQESVLTCIVSGAFGFEATWEEQENSKDTIKSSDKIIIEYIFDEQQILYMNGEEQKDSEDNVIKYSRLMLEVNNTTDLANTKVYLIENSTDDESNFVVTFLAKQADLYEYINTLEV